jgi:uncharacterized protein
MSDPLRNVDFADQIILHAWRGSVAHGMCDDPHPDSIDDKDTMAIAVPPLENYIGLRSWAKRGAKEIRKDDWDIVVYEAGKAFKMLFHGNPNVISLLWLPAELMISTTPAGELLRTRRDLFVGQWLYPSFVRYAKEQMHKMTHCSVYLGARRKALVAKHGFDCKNAAHVIRLLRMACEFLQTGELIVDRSGIDATELLDIKHGEWSLQQVEREATRTFVRAEEAYCCSTLPLKPDEEAINDLCMRVISLGLKQTGQYVVAPALRVHADA